jgi:ceramide glucosyltransferase
MTWALAVTWLLAALVAGSTVYCLLVIEAARRYKATAAPISSSREPVSVLKPLAGIDLDLESNLRTFFEQDHPGPVEILFAVREPNDPAAALAQKLRGDYPNVPSRLIVTGEAPYPNRKVWALEKMTAAANFDLLAMSDSDIRVTPAFVRTAAAEFQDPWLQVSTCPYRALAGGGLWSRLEAIGMNTEFLAGILVARMIEGMRFAVGPTIVARKSAIEKLGGWRAFRDYLAEDFVLGQRAAGAGLGVGLSGYVVEHHIGSHGFAGNMAHRLRWVRSTRRSRPAGYVGELFTKTLPLACLLWIATPAWWPLSVVALAARIAAAFATAGWVLRDVRGLWLLPIQDLLSFLFWFAGFFGNTIGWRGRRYYLHPDGRFEPI